MSILSGFSREKVETVRRQNAWSYGFFGSDFCRDFPMYFFFKCDLSFIQQQITELKETNLK